MCLPARVNFYKTANKIDIHNQIWQGFLALEEHWKTNDGFFRIQTIIIDMVVADVWLIVNHSSFIKDHVLTKLQLRAREATI